MGTIGWLALIAVGIALGIGIGRAWPVRTAKMAALEQEKDQARNELGQYREEVSAHFERTAELFDKVTADYRSLYEHLALSARQLGAIEGESERSLEEPEQRRLGPGSTPAPTAEGEPDTEPEPGADSAPEPESPVTADRPDAPAAASTQRRDA